MKKVIYIYWGQKFINAPYIVKKCLLSWKLKNPTWNIVELDDDNLYKYINIEEEIPNLKNKKIKIPAYSDIIRILLLAKHGGCWCDATTYCNQSLDNWLHKNISTGFFAFDKPGKDRLLSSWFLYSEVDNYIIKKWKEITIIYWKNHDEMNHYFWFHYLFGDLYNSDNEFKNMFDLTPTISANEPHFVQYKGLLKIVSDEVKNHIDEIKIPVYKLTHWYDTKQYNENCNLYYLLQKLNLKFIHIPKTAGTSIENAAQYNNLLWGRFDKSLKSFGSRAWHCPQKTNCYCFCVIREPFDRFISQFYHDNDIKDYNSKKLNKYIENIIPQLQTNINIHDNHFLHQYKFYEMCNISISFNDLQINLNKLMKLFNLPIIVLDKLPGGDVQQAKRYKININRLTDDDINDKNRNLIKDIYKLDFDLYNNVKKVGILIKN